MNAVEYMQSDVATQGTLCDILRETTSSSYSDGGESIVDTVRVAIYAAQSSSQMTPAGMDPDTAFSGLVVPERDGDGDLIHPVDVGDVLRPQSNTALRYTVETKDGLPNDIDPSLWMLGLSRGN